MSPNAKRREPVSHPHTACENAAEKSVPSKLFLVIGLIIGLVLATSTHASAEQSAPIPDGTVIFWQGGPLTGPILRHTGSRITHAAIILDGWVYEATPPRVHKVRLGEYMASLRARAVQTAGFSWFVLQPQRSYTPEQLVSMRRYADSQLGRPYMLRGWWQYREVRGIFCSQFVGDAIEQSGKIVSAHFRESPVSLYGKLSEFYQSQTVKTTTDAVSMAR